MNSQSYLRILENEKSFTRDDLFQAMRHCGNSISEALFKVRLQDLLKTGAIVRVGRNAYCIPSKDVYQYEHLFSEMARETAAEIQEHYPFLDFMIFEMIQLNEFVNHQLAHNVIFVSVENGLQDFVFDTLKERYPGKVLLCPTTELYHQYWYDNMIVIERLITETPKDRKNSWGTRLEKILVDLHADPLLINSISGSEYPGIYEQAFQKYVIDESCLFRYAKRRGAQKKVLEFIQKNTDIHLKTRG